MGLIGLIVIEITKIYFIVAMPGSHQWDSLAFAYFFHIFLF